MKKDKRLSVPVSGPRLHAKKLVSSNMLETLPAGKKKDTLRLFHELEVHKTELEMQNAELRKTRDELESSLAVYADLYDFSPLAYFTLARNGAIKESNLTGASFLGVERSLLIGRNFKLFVPDKERPVFLELLDRVFSSKTKESCEVPLAIEGQFAYFVRIEAVADRSSRDCRLAVIDITQRKQTEEELQKSELKYRALFENSLDAILFTIRDGTIRAANRAACEMFGMTEEELIRVGRDGIIDPSDRRFVTAFEARECDGNFFGELTYLRKDGSSFQTETNSGILDGGVNFFVILHNIKERKKAEQDLRDSEERYRRLFEMESDAILLVDQETTCFLDANIAAQKMYGYTMEEFLRLTAGDVSAEPDKTRKIISAKQNWVPYRLHRKKDGTIFPVEIVGSYFEYKGRDVHVSSIRDITERMRSEGEVIAYQEELRAMASELSLVEERERHKIATALHDQVGQTLAMACFKLGELRKAVAPGNLSATVDEIREMLTNAIHNSRTLTFELSPPILYDLGLEAAISSLAERYRKDHSIRIDYLDDSQPKPLSEDMRILLFQAVRELLVNAVKHAHPQRITVSCLREGTDIKVVVEDDGVGFATAEDAVLRGKTHGFGLFSLRERLKYLGGSIAIKSAPGRGAQITLTAPLATEPDNRRE